MPKPIVNLTRQQMLNKAVRGLASQGFRKCAIGGTCLYSNKTGTRHCAIGWLLPKRHPALSMEGGVVTLRAKYPDLFDWGLEHDDFLTTLQAAHDFATNAKTMRIRLRMVADQYDLKLPPQLKGRK